MNTTAAIITAAKAALGMYTRYGVKNCKAIMTIIPEKRNQFRCIVYVGITV